MNELAVLSEAIIEGDIEGSKRETQRALDVYPDANKIIERGLLPAMDKMRSKFSEGEIFAPELYRAALAVQESINAIKSQSERPVMPERGKVVLGTTRGNINGLDKDLLSIMLESAGLTIVDLGLSASPEEFGRKAKAEQADIVLISAEASMPNSYTSIRQTMDVLEELDIRDDVKVMISCGAITDKDSKTLKADQYVSDPVSAVAEAEKLLGDS